MTENPARRILVVEDEPVINQAITDRLRAEGFDVVQAWDGPSAVEVFGTATPDLVVLDVMLPATTAMRYAAASRRNDPCLS